MPFKFIVLVCLLGGHLQGINGAGGSGRENKECNAIGNILKTRGFTYPWWDAAAPGDSSSFSQICPNIVNQSPRATKCCTSSFDTAIQRKEMSLAMNKWLTEKLTAAAETFKERKTKFDITFKSLLARAHTSFHAMFERTYGMLYIQHAHVFHALFTTLEKYYDDGREPLEAKLNEFFSILTRKMFEVLNAQYEFNEAYLSCAAIAIGKKQGMDLHRQIVSSLRRSFVATKALAQGLQESERILTNMQKFQVTSPGCLVPMSEMLHCPICVEQRAFKPCVPFCTSVTSNCLKPTTALSKPWAEFVAALEGVVDRLLGPYNVEAVVEPIHIKISEAIMNFQESGPDLSQAVFSDCGKPKLRSRNKRDTPSTQGGAPFLSDSNSHSESSELQPSKSLEKLLRETKNRVRKSKTLWEVLPKQVCNAISKDFSSQLCWNGTSSMKPEKTKNNEEISPSSPSSYRHEPNSIIDEQILQLNSITEKLKQAYNGLDVHWTTQEEEDDFGSGMGSGSGDVPTDLEEGDDDDPSGQIKPKSKPPFESTRKPINPFRDSNTRITKPFQPNENHDIVENRVPPKIHPPFDNFDVDEDDEDRLDKEEEENVPPKQKNEIKIDGNGGNSNGGIDFGVFIPTPEPPRPPKSNQPPDYNTPPRQTPTTKKPAAPGTEDKHNRGADKGGDNVAEKTVALLKLFTPVVSSILGKLFKFS